MTHPFPQETVDIYLRALEAWKKERPSRWMGNKLKDEHKLGYARGALADFKDLPYGFLSNLRTGNYAHWPHEINEQHLSDTNCTTIVPKMYLYCEMTGLKPQIIQFHHFRRIREKEDQKDPFMGHHFALIIDANKKHPYLFDPFWSTFGPILQQTAHQMRIGKDYSKAERREFEKVVYYSPETFVAMMNRLKEPAESLDMLVAGQKVYEGKLLHKKTNCTLMVYYDDGNNDSNNNATTTNNAHTPAASLTTRLFIPQVDFPAQAVYCRMNLNEQGEVEKTGLKLVVAKEAHWNSLSEEKIITRTDFPTLRAVRRDLKKVARSHYRLGPELLKKKNRKTAEDLLDVVQQLWDELSPREQEKLQPQVYGRTLYELTQPQKQYLSTPQERDKRYIKLTYDSWKEEDKVNSLRRRTFFHKNRVQQMDRNKFRRIDRQRQQRQKKMNKLSEEGTELINLRWNNKPAYDRNRDKWMFNQSLGKSMGKPIAQELERRVHEQQLDWRIGYLAMIAEYIPFIFDKENHLELKFCRDSIKEKVAARRAKRKDQNVVTNAA